MKTNAREEELIHPDIGQAHTLPSRFYTDPAFLARENERIFARTWQVVGRSEQVAKPGDYFTANVAGEALLLARDSAGELRGFHNVCRHRAGPPAEGCGNRKLFRCGYHGWAYSLEGKLLNAPEFEGVADFRKEEFGLRPVQAAEWGGFVFVNLDDRAEPLEDALGELPRQVEKFHFERLRLYRRHDYVMECDWKAYIDNYLEGYHLPSVHPGLNRELDYGSYQTTLFPRHSLQASPIRGAEKDKGAPRHYQAGEGELSAEYFWIFPNWMLNCYPDNMSLNVVLPVGPGKCVAIFEWYFPEEALKTDGPEQTVKFSDEIQQEDGHICEVVYRNLQSRHYDRGRYSVKQEKGVHHFHRLYAERMA
jgi:choline monooxygenase